MRRYIVFMKQVPRSMKVEMDSVTHTLKRSSALVQTNPDDLYALQAALDLRRETGAEVVAVSMGPSSAEEVLREALQRGADRAVLLSSPAFAGSDTWCTSLVLAAAARKVGDYDLLFFGRMAIDGDTAQVGPEVAGQLDIPQVTNMVSLDGCSGNVVHVRRKSGDVVQYLDLEMPCAVMVGRENGILDYLTLSGWRHARKQGIVRWNESDLQLDRTQVGLLASPTRVVSVSVPQTSKTVQWLSDASSVMAIIDNCIHPLQ